MRPGSPEQRAVDHVAVHAVGRPLDRGLRVSVNFHPDRLTGQGATTVPTLVSMRQSGVYLSQFVTGLSSGGLTAHPGGDRWRWESRMFGGSYDEAAPNRRPVYGALNHADAPTGGSPRFGSAPSVDR